MGSAAEIVIDCQFVVSAVVGACAVVGCPVVVDRGSVAVGSVVDAEAVVSGGVGHVQGSFCASGDAAMVQLPVGAEGGTHDRVLIRTQKVVPKHAPQSPQSDQLLCWRNSMKALPAEFCARHLKITLY